MSLFFKKSLQGLMLSLLFILNAHALEGKAIIIKNQLLNQSNSTSVDIERRERSCGGVVPDGKKTLCHIKYDYNNTTYRCNQNNNEPGFLCSGVLMRGTDNDLNRTYYSWNPSPLSVKSGGVSFSFLREDAKFSKLAYLYTTGFIFFPNEFTPKKKKNDIIILCGFPLDAGTNNRSDKGCGSYSNVSISRPCIEQGIFTANDWFDINYENAGNREHTCGFTFYSPDKSINTTQQFEAMMKSQILLKEQSFKQQNELRVETWAQNDPRIPLEAFFYLAGNSSALKSSQKDQREFYDQFKEIIPIIEITFSSSINDDVIFGFNDGDQVIK